MSVGQASRTEWRGRDALRSWLALAWPTWWPGRDTTPELVPMRIPLPQHLSPWIKSPRGHERVRALGLSACLLQYFLEHLHVSVSTHVATTQPRPSHPHSCPGDRPGDHCMWPSVSEFPVDCPPAAAQAHPASQ